MSNVSWGADFLKFVIELMVYGIGWYLVWWTIKSAVKTAIEEVKKDERVA